MPSPHGLLANDLPNGYIFALTATSRSTASCSTGSLMLLSSVIHRQRSWTVDCVRFSQPVSRRTCPPISCSCSWPAVPRHASMVIGSKVIIDRADRYRERTAPPGDEEAPSSPDSDALQPRPVDHSGGPAPSTRGAARHQSRRVLAPEPGRLFGSRAATESNSGVCRRSAGASVSKRPRPLAGRRIRPSPDRQKRALDPSLRAEERTTLTGRF